MIDTPAFSAGAAATTHALIDLASSRVAQARLALRARHPLEAGAHLRHAKERLEVVDSLACVPQQERVEALRAQIAELEQARADLSS